MTYFNPDSEDAAVEQPTIALFAEFGWETLNCYHENFGPPSLLGRDTMAEVVLPNRIRAAIEAADKGSDLTKRMLAFSRLQALHNRDINTNDMVMAMHDMLQQAITGAVDLSIVPKGDVWHVKADKTMLETAILNLAINARDAMGQNGGKLIIETHNRTLDQPYSDANEEV